MVFVQVLGYGYITEPPQGHGEEIFILELLLYYHTILLPSPAIGLGLWLGLLQGKANILQGNAKRAPKNISPS